MGLPWIRLETGFYTNAKFITLADHGQWRAAHVAVCAMAWAGSQGTNGYIPKGALKYINGRPKDAEILVNVGLWNAAEGGWEIQSWADYQPSISEYQERKERMKRRGQAGGLARVTNAKQATSS
jgi:hypothetical protein